MSSYYLYASLILFFIAVIDIFVKPEIMLKIFMFGVSDPKKYNPKLFIIFHSANCFLAAIFIALFWKTSNLIWFWFAIATIVILYILVFTVAKKGTTSKTVLS